MKSEKKSQEDESNILAVVRVRGLVNLRHDIKKTFEYLNLHTKNWCIVVEDTPTLKGMVLKVKDYVTWGEISKDTLDEMIKMRGELYQGRLKDSKSHMEYNKFVIIDGKKYNRFFRLSPPKKGYGRKGIKFTFVQGGALGYRGEKINDLLRRMI